MQHIQKRRARQSAAASGKATGQTSSQWLAPAGFSFFLVVLTVFLYFVGLVFREAYFSAFGVDVALVPIEKQDYIYLGGKAAFYALTRFVGRLGSDGRVVGSLLAVGATLSLLVLLADWGKEKARRRTRTSQWVRLAVFRNATFVMVSSVGMWFGALLVFLVPTIVLAIPGVLGERVGRDMAEEARTQAMATSNCARKVKDATCIEVVDDEGDEVVVTGVLLGGNKDHVAILNADGVHVVALGSRTVKPLFQDGLPALETK